MALRPTFDQLAHTPDLEERLTTVQAVALIRHVAPRVERLALVVAETMRTRLSRRVVTPERPARMRAVDELIASSDRSKHPDWVCVAVIPWQHPATSFPMNVPLQWWWEREELRVGWWLVESPGWEWEREAPTPATQR